MRVGTYARISELIRPTDSNVGTYAVSDAELLDDAISRQEDDTRALARLRGWTLAETYQDPDYSAYQPKVTRPDFERMLKDLETADWSLRFLSR
jgi:DNA invertase Pin-like site-specific DNA recombinase